MNTGIGELCKKNVELEARREELNAGHRAPEEGDVSVEKQRRLTLLEEKLRQETQKREELRRTLEEYEKLEEQRQRRAMALRIFEEAEVVRRSHQDLLAQLEDAKDRFITRSH